MAPLGGLQQQQTSNNSQGGSTAVQQQRQLQFTQREVRQDTSGGNINNNPPSMNQQQSSSGNGNQNPQQQQQQTNQGNSNNNNNQPQQQQQQQAPQYSIPGILHFLQFEWQRFEVERQQWNVERAELQARIALLQGERKGQENLKNDLVRRIKMLEYCLKQERVKFHRLKFGTDPPGIEGDAVDAETNEDMGSEGDNPLTGLMNKNNNILDDSTTGLNWKHGRQLLRQYLQEIGYTDTIIDVRSNRVRSLLGLNNNMNANNAVNSALGIDISSLEGNNKTGINNRTTAQTVRRGNSNAGAATILGDTEASVLATFDFLHDQRDGHSRDDEDDDEEEDIGDDPGVSGSSGNYNIDSETEEVLAEFDFLNTQSSQTTSSQQQSNVKHHQIQQQQQQQDANWRSRIPDIGELANLTLNNESDMNGINSSVTGGLASNVVTAADYRKTWNPKYILKSHFDCIRSLRFHPQEPLLITCSEDETLKLWNLNKTQTTSNKSGKSTPQNPQSQANPTTFDLEPVHTFRGHSSRVLCITLEHNVIFSGSQTGELFCWSLPDNMINIDPYDTFDASMTPGSFVGHTDAIWSLLTKESVKNSSLLLVSVSADSSLRVWEVSSRHCLKTIYFKDGQVRPTCVSCILNSNSCSIASTPGSSLVVVSFTNGTMKVFDIENDSVDPVLSFETSSDESTLRTNAVVVHPTMPIVVSAHEDRQIKFWDLNNGKCVHSMVAHLDEVTCLAVDPTGLFLLSGSHDCSVRLWNFESRTCVQEITSHRKKFDEAIFDVTFHPQKSFFASAGADGLAKVFV